MRPFSLTYPLSPAPIFIQDSRNDPHPHLFINIYPVDFGCKMRPPTYIPFIAAISYIKRHIDIRHKTQPLDTRIGIYNTYVCAFSHRLALRMQCKWHNATGTCCVSDPSTLSVPGGPLRGSPSGRRTLHITNIQITYGLIRPFGLLPFLVARESFTTS